MAHDQSYLLSVRNVRSSVKGPKRYRYRVIRITPTFKHEGFQVGCHCVAVVVYKTFICKWVTGSCIVFHRKVDILVSTPWKTRLTLFDE